MNARNALLDALDAGRVIVLPSTDKETALRLLAESIESAPGFPKVTDFRTVLLRREAESPAYLGYGIAMPHARVQQGDRPICAVGWSPAGIEYGNSDGWAVHIVLMYCVPQTVQHEYLAEVSRLARAIEQDRAGQSQVRQLLASNS